MSVKHLSCLDPGVRSNLGTLFLLLPPELSILESADMIDFQEVAWVRSDQGLEVEQGPGGGDRTGAGSKQAPRGRGRP